MIPQAFINEWRQCAPWLSEAQIEQDLILTRAITEIFSDPLLSSTLAFRGGTALHKLFLQPAARYSEDIDLVQVNKGPIGPIMEALRKKLTPWLGEPRWNNKNGRVTIVYRFESESQPITPMRLKVEINTREHFAVLGLTQKLFEIKSLWHSQEAAITTFHLEELLATKLRALYQRKKGRDLFDLAVVLNKFPNLDVKKMLHSFEKYMAFDRLRVSRAEFEANLSCKLNDEAFVQDIFPLLPSKLNLKYSPFESMILVQDQIINKLQGESWKGSEFADNKT